MVEEEYIRTSLRMTRVISDEIGETLEDILRRIHTVFDPEAKEEDKINMDYGQWQYLVTQLFNDETLIVALKPNILFQLSKINLEKQSNHGIVLPRRTRCCARLLPIILQY